MGSEPFRKGRPELEGGLSGDLADSAEGGVLDIVKVESLGVTHCDGISEVGERRLFILVEDLVVWLDEVIGRRRLLLKILQIFGGTSQYIYIYRVMCHQKLEGFSIVDDGLPITSSSQITRASTSINDEELMPPPPAPKKTRVRETYDSHPP